MERSLKLKSHFSTENFTNLVRFVTVARQKCETHFLLSGYKPSKTLQKSQILFEPILPSNKICATQMTFYKFYTRFLQLKYTCTNSTAVFYREVRHFQVFSRSFYIQTIPGRGAWPVAGPSRVPPILPGTTSTVYRADAERRLKNVILILHHDKQCMEN